MSAKPNFQRSADTSLLVTLFGRAAVGDIVTYAAIREMIGRAPDDCRQAIHSALRIVHAEQSMVFANVPKEGYRRLDDEQIVASTADIRERQHRLSRKAVKRLAVVETDKLTEVGKRDYFTHLSIQGALQHVTAAKSQKAIASKVNGATQQLAVTMTLKALAE